jgi:tRNA threonylcarbamoyladenosine biosynthesis protein TsaB
MRILALETSTEYCSVAVWQDGEIFSHSKRVGQKHSEVLIGMVDDVLNEAGVALGQLDGIAFGEGPGSFTGVRIACGAAQGLALGANLPVAGVSTLMALAQGSGKDRVIAALDARMSEVYHAAYRKQDGQWMTVCEPALILPENAPRVEGGGWYGAGSGYFAHGEGLKRHYAENLADVDEWAVPEASAISRIAVPIFAAGKGIDPAIAIPVYLRDKVALTTAEREQVA